MGKKDRETEDFDVSLSSGQKARFTRLYNEVQDDAKKKVKELEKIYTDFTTDTTESPSYLKRLQDLETKSLNLHKEIAGKITAIESLHEKISTVDEEQGTTIQDDIDDFLTNYQDRLSDITSLRTQFVAYKKELEGFESEDGSKVPGLKDKIQAQAKQFDQNLKEYQKKNETFLTDNETKFSALKEKIESLLPGASTVGIAKSFEQHKDSFKWPILMWSGVFLVSLSGMIVYALSLDRNNINDLNDVGIRILNNLPFFLPAIWIAIYASKQQSQNKRLQQEYAFKEDVAKSYQGFKKEIENLDEDEESNVLKLQFMQRLVDIIGENPTSTLEHRSHKDKPPLLDEFSDRFKKAKSKPKTSEKENEPTEEES